MSTHQLSPGPGHGTQSYRNFFASLSIGVTPLGRTGGREINPGPYPSDQLVDHGSDLSCDFWIGPSTVAGGGSRAPRRRCSRRFRGLGSTVVRLGADNL